MPRFHYSLQSVLNIKQKMETQARQEFSEARNRLDEEEKHLSELQQRKAKYEEQLRSRLSGILHVMDIEESKNATLTMDSMIDTQKVKVYSAQQKLERTREKLEDVMKERKIHENLREKAFEAYIQEENRLESKSVDELTSYTYGQKRQVKE